jgi:type IV pilus assembly protein PilE
MRSLRRLSGFTLIELLVVIAIIGTLSSVVLASLNTARLKSADANIQAALSAIRVQAELYYDTNAKYAPTSYEGDCGATPAAGVFSDPVVLSALAQIKANNGGAAIDCGTSLGKNYSIAVTLRTGSYWCIDDRGVSRGATASGVPYAGLTGVANAAHLVVLGAACS